MDKNTADVMLATRIVLGIIGVVMLIAGPCLASSMYGDWAKIRIAQEVTAQERAKADAAHSLEAQAMFQHMTNKAQ